MARILLLPWGVRHSERSKVFPRQSVARVVVEEACVKKRPFAARVRFH